MRRAPSTDLIDRFARVLAIDGWYTWMTPEETEQSIAAGSVNRPLVDLADGPFFASRRSEIVATCVDALRRRAEHSNEWEVDLVEEIMSLTEHGIDYTGPEARFSLAIVPGEVLTGLQVLCYLYVGLQLLDPSIDAGIPIADAFQEALRIHRGELLG